MSKVSVRQAALLTGKSRDTINVATNDGTLSCGRNARGHKVIDVAELERVFGKLKSPDVDSEPSGKTVGKRPKVSDSDVGSELLLLREKLKHTEQLFETSSSERRREREQLQSEIEHLRGTLERTQSEHRQAMLLITHQTNQGQGLQQMIDEQKALFDKQLSEATAQASAEAIAAYESNWRNRAWWELLLPTKKQAS